LLLSPDGQYPNVIADGYFGTGTVSTLAAS
jgi:hypothetical protein